MIIYYLDKVNVRLYIIQESQIKEFHKILTFFRLF